MERILLLLWMGLLVEYGLKDVYSFNKIHMACGLPVISTDMCLGATELIESKINGEIVPVDNEEELIKAMQWGLFCDRKKIGVNNIKKIQEYTYENVVDKHINAINEILL